jgi:hypothetical protein
MRRLLLAVGLVVAGVLSVVGVDALADATQNRRDPRPDPDSTSQVVFEVDTQRYPGSIDAGTTLWTACQGTIHHETLEVTEVGEDTFQATVRPELGKHARRRLVGCLEDATVDRLNGHVVTIVNPPRP